MNLELHTNSVFFLNEKVQLFFFSNQNSFLIISSEKIFI